MIVGLKHRQGLIGYAIICLLLIACTDSKKGKNSAGDDTTRETEYIVPTDGDTGTGPDSDGIRGTDTSTDTGGDTWRIVESDSASGTGIDSDTDTASAASTAATDVDLTADTGGTDDSDASSDMASDSTSDLDTSADTGTGADTATVTDTGFAGDSQTGSDTGTETAVDLKPGDADDDGIPDEIEIGSDPLHPIDTDGDGIPDFQDLDSDGDTIGDRWEKFADPDGDGIPAWRDLDSDGDCVPDAAEAGDAVVETRPVDTDGDGLYNFLDLDSDNDGLPDSQEDLNCNGVLDSGETSILDDDCDDDGVSDLIEIAAGTNPNDAADNPQANGDFVFLVPWQKNPSPEDDTIDFSTSIVKSDVVFAMDTTGSMGGERLALMDAIGALIDTLRNLIPNIGFAVVGYDDFPGSAFNEDEPFYLLHRVMTINGGAGSAADVMIQNAVSAYPHHSGGDGPESAWEMFHQVMTGAGTTEDSATVPAFNDAIGPPTPAEIPTGEEIGTIGGVGFRTGALPIIIWITDADNHNSDVSNTGSMYDFAAATQSQAVAELVNASARVVTVISASGVGFPERDAAYVVEETNSFIPPGAWGPVTSRPLGCDVDQCCTGMDGLGKAVDDVGRCALIFDVSDAGQVLGIPSPRRFRCSPVMANSTLADDRWTTLLIPLTQWMPLLTVLRRTPPAPRHVPLD